MDTSAYIAEAESFLTSLNREYFEHDAGLKATLEIGPIYARHGCLFEPGVVASMLGHRSDRRGRYRARFAAFGMIDCRLGEITEEIAAAVSRSTVEWQGEDVPLRKALAIAGNEPDTDRRRELERRTAAATAPMNPQRWRRLGESHRSALDLGFADYVQMSDDLYGFRLADLVDQTRELLTHTQDAYDALLDAHLAALGLDSTDGTAADFMFMRRGTQFDGLFPKSRLLTALFRTLAGLGIELDRQGNVHLDLEERPLKSPRAFCAPIQVPQDIRLSIRPRGGHDDYLTLFHETGHAEHMAHVRADAPFSYRCLGDNSVSEAFAFLLGKLPATRLWLHDVLEVKAVDPYLALVRFVDLYYARRTAAKLTYEIELHRAPDIDAMPDRYTELLGRATRLHQWRENFLADVDDGFYCACYLRAWMLEVLLRRRLTEDFGPRWFATPEAGRFLKDLWALGQELTADEIAEQIGFPGLDVEALISDLASPTAS